MGLKWESLPTGTRKSPTNPVALVQASCKQKSQKVSLCSNPWSLNVWGPVTVSCWLRTSGFKRKHFMDVFCHVFPQEIKYVRESKDRWPRGLGVRGRIKGYTQGGKRAASFLKTLFPCLMPN